MFSIYIVGWVLLVKCMYRFCVFLSECGSVVFRVMKLFLFGMVGSGMVVSGVLLYWLLRMFILLCVLCVGLNWCCGLLWVSWK